MLGQTLHGYEDGHVLIAGSLHLRDAAAEVMLLMSDLAPAGPPPPEGWLTGYPLPSMDAYVLARTWPAPEMPRPGCVWTHSLILDYATLGTLRGFDDLARLFQRPSRGDFAGYARSLVDPPSGEAARLHPRNYSAGREAIVRLYAQGGVATVPCAGAEADQLALAVWAQQWPRLRRRMRWATVPIARSSAVAEFDLMMDPQQTPRAPDADPLFRQGWVVGALADLRSGGGPIRSRLRQFGIDVAHGRRAFSPLVAAALLSARPERSNIARLLEQLEQRLPEEGSVAKASLLAAYLRTGGPVPPKLLGLAFGHLPDLAADPDALTTVASACLEIDPDRFWGSLRDRYPAASDQVIAQAPREALKVELTRDPSHARAVMELRPDLSPDPEVWRISPEVRAVALAFARSDRRTLKEALKAALTGLDVEAGRSLTAETGSGILLDLITEGLRKQKTSKLSPGERDWIAAAAEDLGGVRRHLEGASGHNLVFIQLARRLGPMSFEPERQAVDPWFKAWNNAKGSFDRADGEFIAAFFLVRACRFDTPDRAAIFGVAANTMLEAIDKGLTDTQAVHMVSDLSIRNYFNPFETRYGAFTRGLAIWGAIQGVPIHAFVANGRSRHVEALLGELRYARGGQEVIRAALSSKTALPKRRRQMLEAARL